jgi:hypothetical protein
MHARTIAFIASIAITAAATTAHAQDKSPLEFDQPPGPHTMAIDSAIDPNIQWTSKKVIHLKDGYPLMALAEHYKDQTWRLCVLGRPEADPVDGPRIVGCAAYQEIFPNQYAVNGVLDQRSHTSFVTGAEGAVKLALEQALYVFGQQQ